MKTIIPLFFILFSFHFFASGQEMKVKFGKVSPEDLAMKVYPQDTEAVAVVLSKVGRIKYDVLKETFPLTEQRYEAVKILKKPGIDAYGNVEIRYYSHENYSKVGEIKAIVHLPDGTDIKVDDSQIFEVKENDYWSSKRIAFPGLVPGAILEYQYTILSDRMLHPVDWYFQDRIPIVHAELTTKIPEWFDFVVLTQGLPLDKHDTEMKMESVTINYIARGTGAFDNSTMNNASANVKFVINTYVNKDVPALKEECCITTMDDYYSRVRYQLNAVQFPNSARQPVLNTWTEVAKRLYALPEWGGQFRNKRPGELVLEAAGINLTTMTDQMEIAQKLYDYINQNFQWNGIYSIGFGKEISGILKEKACHSGDLNKMMCAALIQAGIPAKPALISTRENGKPLELYPFLDQFDHMVVLATINNKDIWIDLGDDYGPIGLLRPNALNERAWIADETNPFWTDVIPFESKTVYYIKGNIDHDGNLTGNLETRFTGYHAWNQRLSAGEEKEKFGENLIRCGSNPVKLSDIEFINSKEISMPFQLKATISNFPVAMVISDKLFISPVFPAGFDEIIFKLEDRTYPIEINYPEEVSMILDLTLPDGYVAESIPKPVKFVTENNGIQVSYNATHAPAKLNVTMKHTIKQLEFHPEQYSTLKTIYNERHKKFNEQIVLIKS